MLPGQRAQPGGLRGVAGQGGAYGGVGEGPAEGVLEVGAVLLGGAVAGERVHRCCPPWWSSAGQP